MAIERKYGRVTTERGTIGEDEPVVVFRAQDALLPELLAMYLHICHTAGSPQHHLDGIKKTIVEVEAWQAKNFTKIPTSDSWRP